MNTNSCVLILKGRLGNLMFRFSSDYGLSRHHQCKLYVDEFYIRTLESIFTINIKHMSIYKSEYFNLIGIISRPNVASYYFEDLMKPNSIKYLQITGYWQAFRHFIKYTNEIQEQFTSRGKRRIWDFGIFLGFPDFFRIFGIFSGFWDFQNPEIQQQHSPVNEGISG